MSRLISTSTGRRISESCRVSLHFSVLLESGEEVDTTRRGKPASFAYGDGSLLPGFEAALLGMRAGDDAQILLEPEGAFGLHRPENVQIMLRNQFAELDLEPGLLISFAGPGGELPGIVRKVYDKRVQIDFNHPLAGRRVVFDVSILGVEEPD